MAEDPSARAAAVPSELVCSARACRAAAVWGLRWNNPRLHPEERRKTWLACDAHRADLSGFLDLRGFLREVVTVEQLAADGRAADGRAG